MSDSTVQRYPAPQRSVRGIWELVGGKRRNVRDFLSPVALNDPVPRGHGKRALLCSPVHDC